MPGWLKALLIVAIIVVLLIVGVVGAGVFWWMRNKDALMARAKEVVTEAKDFGSKTVRGASMKASRATRKSRGSRARFPTPSSCARVWMRVSLRLVSVMTYRRK